MATDDDRLGLPPLVREIAARTALIAGLVTLLASSGHGQSGDPDWTVYLRRAGALRIGMSIVQVRQELGDPDAFLVQALRQNRELPRDVTERNRIASPNAGSIVALPGGCVQSRAALRRGS